MRSQVFFVVDGKGRVAKCHHRRFKCGRWWISIGPISLARPLPPPINSPFLLRPPSPIKGFSQLGRQMCMWRTIRRGEGLTTDGRKHMSLPPIRLAKKKKFLLRCKYLVHRYKLREKSNKFCLESYLFGVRGVAGDDSDGGGKTAVGESEEEELEEEVFLLRPPNSD